MIQRCTNPRNASFKHYGGRGIRVCDKWRGSFESFFVAMGPRPTPKHSLDRRDNGGNYEPDNCRWATPEEQQRNTRKNRIVEAFGERKTMTEWSQERGVPIDTLWRRLTVWKWDPERAVSEPTRPTVPMAGKFVRAAGYPSVSAFLRKHGMSAATFYKFVAGNPVRQKTRDRLLKLLKL